MSDTGRALYTVNDIRYWEIASLAAKILAEISYKRPFLLTYYFRTYSLSGVFLYKLECYPFFAVNHLVDIVVDSNWLDFFP